MQIIKPSATLLWVTPDAEKNIEIAGRICYKSEEKIGEDSAEKFIGMLMNRCHMSVVEHAAASIKFVCDRGVTHEMVRHRVASYSQESTRYCNYGKDKFGREISVIEPEFKNPADREHWLKAVQAAEDAYLAMLDNNVPPQIARSVLPTCLKTEIVMTANFREWLHFFHLRCAPEAHPQIREIANEARELLREAAPSIFK